jgi:hypothetical protein
MMTRTAYPRGDTCSPPERWVVAIVVAVANVQAGRTRDRPTSGLFVRIVPNQVGDGPRNKGFASKGTLRNGWHDVPMTKLERQATSSMKELLAALAEARDEIRRSEQGIRRTLRKVERGQGLASVVIADSPSEGRQSLDDAMETLTSLRHRTRSLVFALAVEEGLSIGEVGRTWGISRQLASRYVREASDGRR